MYIKQVLIEGFKSYKELVQPEPFSPKVNCVGKKLERLSECRACSWNASFLPGCGQCPDLGNFRDFCAAGIPGWIDLSLHPRLSPRVPFSVGANGSGKSNFFYGEQRKHLLGRIFHASTAADDTSNRLLFLSGSIVSATSRRSASISSRLDLGSVLVS